MACIALVVAGLGVFYLAARFLIRVRDDMMLAKCKRMAQKNPGIGFKDGEGDFVYKQGRFTFKYRLIQEQVGGPQVVKCVAFKRRLSGYEERVTRVQGAMHAFWLYKKWRSLFNVKFLIPIAALLLLLYFSGLESEESKAQRLRWVVAGALHVGIDAVAVDPGGNVVVSGERRLKGVSEPEQVSYNFNVADWLTSRDAGFITRRTGSSGHEAVYPVQYQENGAVTINNDGKLLQGELTGNTLRWNKPQGGAQVKEEIIYGEDGSPRPAGKVLIEDK